MDINIQCVVYVATAHMLLLMMVMIIETRKWHAHEPIAKNSYNLMIERERMRIEYLNDKTVSLKMLTTFEVSSLSTSSSTTLIWLLILILQECS
jgi:hypothetical protein